MGVRKRVTHSRHRDHQSLFGEKACAQQKVKFSSTAEDLQVWTSPKVFTIGRFKRLLTTATATARARKCSLTSYKVNLCCLKLIRAYSISLNSSNVGKYKFSCFSSRATTAAKCAKKRDARAKLLFCLTYYKPLLFLPFSLLSSSLTSKLTQPQVTQALC